VVNRSRDAINKIAYARRKEVSEDAMKFYLAHAVTRDGEHEYGEQFTLAAEHEREAEEKATHYLLEVYGDPDADAFDEDGMLDLFDRIVTFDGVREIPKGDYAVLRNYL
jgi:hypothetical protein